MKINRRDCNILWQFTFTVFVVFKKNYFVLLRGISVSNNKKSLSLLSWNAVELLFKKTQFLVNQSAKLNEFVLSHSPTLLLSSKFSSVCAFQD